MAKLGRKKGTASNKFVSPSGQKVTPMQDKFAKKYVEHEGNATKAALEVYNITSPKVASTMAAENLAKPSIQEQIKFHSDSVKQKVSKFMNENSILQECIAQAKRDAADPSLRPSDRTAARRFLLDCQKYTDDKDKREVEHKHLHVKLPKR